MFRILDLFFIYFISKDMQGSECNFYKPNKRLVRGMLRSTKRFKLTKLRI